MSGEVSLFSVTTLPRPPAPCPASNPMPLINETAFAPITCRACCDQDSAAAADRCSSKVSCTCSSLLSAASLFVSPLLAFRAFASSVPALRFSCAP